MTGTVEWNGRTRQVRGALTYPTPPDLGTIVGPNGMGERFTVVGIDERGRALMALTTTHDVELAKDEIQSGMGSARSVTERMMSGAGWGAYLQQAADLAGVRLPSGALR